MLHKRNFNRYIDRLFKLQLNEGLFGKGFEDDDDTEEGSLDEYFRSFTMFFACKPAELERNTDGSVDDFIKYGIDEILSDIIDENSGVYNKVDERNVWYHLDGSNTRKWEQFDENKDTIIDALTNGVAASTKVGVESDNDETDGLVVLQIKFYMMMLREESQDKTFKKILRYINYIAQKLDNCIGEDTNGQVKYPFIEDAALLFDKQKLESYDMNNEETRIKFIEQSLILMDNNKPILYPNNKKALYEVLYDAESDDEEEVETNIQVKEPKVKDPAFANISFDDVAVGDNIGTDARNNLIVSSDDALFEVKYCDEGTHCVYLTPSFSYPYPNIKGCVAETDKPAKVNIKWICQNKKDFTDEIDKASEEQKFTKLLHLVAERANKREYFNSTTSTSIIQAFEENGVAFNGRVKYYPSGLLALIQYNKKNYPMNDWQLPTRKMAENMFGNSDDYYCVEDVFDFGDTQITTPEFKTLVPVLIRQLN